MAAGGAALLAVLFFAAPRIAKTGYVISLQSEIQTSQRRMNDHLKTDEFDGKDRMRVSWVGADIQDKMTFEKSLEENLPEVIKGWASILIVIGLTGAGLYLTQK